MAPGGRGRRFSAALCRGLIEAGVAQADNYVRRQRFPRLYVAASLKLDIKADTHGAVGGFSAALCRGLIEALTVEASVAPTSGVFRGFMSRPH